jgi:hypothetical protein
MSQDLSTKPIDPAQAGTSGDRIPGEPWSVDASADRLMDELFEDVDRVLEGGTSLPKSVKAPETVKLKSIQVPQIVMPPLVMPRPPREDATTVDAKATRPGDKKKQKTGKSFDRLLFGGACALLALTVGLLLANREPLQRLWFKLQPQTAQAPVPAAKTPEQLKADADAAFVEYMQRSLEAMDRQAVGAPTEPVPVPNTALQVPMPPAPTVNVNVPPQNVTVTAPHQGNLAEVLNRIAIALERGINPTLVQPNLTVTVPKSPKPPQQTAAAPSPAASPSPTASPSPKPAPKVVAPEPTVAASPPPAAASPSPEPAPEPPPPAPTAEPTTPASSAPGTVHTLVGILELGDRSAALFEINGVARRVNIGESIGSSGWTLVEVEQGEAVIRRNGEVRSIFAGQSF